MILILIGLVILYLLRHLVVQLVVIIVGVAGIVLAIVLIVVGFGLIFGGRAFRRGFTWRVSIVIARSRGLIGSVERSPIGELLT